MSEANSGKLKVRCPCGARMLLPADAAGRKARCPKCAKVFQVPAQAKPTEVEGGDSLLDELAQMEQSAQAVVTPNSASNVDACPQCGAGIPARAALCVSCGYNRESGRTLKRASAGPGVLGGLVRKLGGSFVLGCVLSGLGGVVGAAVWLLIAIITGYVISWIAIGLGALAGYGMTLGYHQRNQLAGVAAAGMSVVAILLAKIMVFAFVIYAVVTGNTSDRDLQREFVKIRIAAEILVERGVFTDEESEEQWESAYAEASERVSGMSDKQIANRLKEIREEEDRQLAYLGEDPKRSRLAWHRAGLRAMELGLSHEDEAHEELYEEEFTRCKAFSQDEVAEALADLEVWEKAGKWSDTAYVRNHLIYQLIDLEITKRAEETEEGYWEETTPEEWTQLLEVARAEVEPLSPEQRVERSRLIDTEIEENNNREELARHRAERRAESMGLSYNSEKREALNEEESARAEKLSGEELKAAVAELRAWEDGGKWSDEDYVRDHLIYQHIDQMIDEHRADASADEDYWEPDEEQWRLFYAEAVARVDAIPEAERAAQSRELEADRMRQWKRRLEQRDREEMTAAAGEVVSVFFESAFHPLDALFFFFAVAMAYRIASGYQKQ